MDVALVGRALAHERHRHLARAPDLGGERDADGVQDLGRDRRADRDDVVRRMAVVAGHLATARRGVVGRGVLGGQDVARRHPEGQAGRDRAVERGDPVVALLEGPGDADLGALVALAADHERDAPGPVEDPHPLVDRPGEGDHAVHLDELGIAQADGITEMPGRSLEALAPSGLDRRGSRWRRGRRCRRSRGARRAPDRDFPLPCGRTAIGRSASPASDVGRWLRS